MASSGRRNPRTAPRLRQEPGESFQGPQGFMTALRTSTAHDVRRLLRTQGRACATPSASATRPPISAADRDGHARARRRPARHRDRAAQGKHRGLLQARSAAACARCVDRQQQNQVGYEIPLNRHFYRYEPPRPLEDIETDIKTLEAEILALLKEVTA